MANATFGTSPTLTARLPKPGLWKRMARYWYAYVLLVPSFALLFTFVYYPAGLALVMSFFDWQPPIRADFVGLLNFQRVLSDPSFWNSWRNMLWIVLWTFTVPFAMPFIVAETIFNLRSRSSQQFYRMVILIPTLVPGMVTLQLWRWIYSYPNGGLNLLLKGVGLNDWVTPWLGTVSTALPALLFMGFPWIVGSAPLIYLAGLMNIPTEIIDASKIDGCSTFRRIREIDIPQIVGQARLFLTFGIIGVFQGFGAQLVLTQGGPYGATMVPGMYLYIKAFGIERFTKNYPQLGEACAVGVMLFLLISVFSFLGQKYVRTAGVDRD
jgi:multiple sugar transport system permease protein/raffinose/stachyose/melibiose transport system permease protein